MRKGQGPQLRIVLPTGTLHDSTRELFGLAHMRIRQHSERQQEGWIDNPPIHVGYARPQDIPGLLHTEAEDCGICGIDCAIESGLVAQLVQVCELEYGKTLSVTGRTKLCVIARRDDSVQAAEEIKPGSRVATELVDTARRHFDQLGIAVTILKTHGSTESWVVNGWAEYGFELVESGATLHANALRTLGDEPVLRSGTALFANPDSWARQEKRQAIEQLGECLRQAINA